MNLLKKIALNFSITILFVVISIFTVLFIGNINTFYPIYMLFSVAQFIFIGYLLFSLLKRKTLDSLCVFIFIVFIHILITNYINELNTAQIKEFIQMVK